MKGSFFFTLLLFAQLCLGQTKDLIKVPGTKCSLRLPDGFVVATTFSGFQDVESGASIMVNEIPAPYQSMTDGFSAEAMKTRGMTLINKETIDFKGSKATLISVTQLSNDITYLKQMLIFGDEKQTVLVNGIYPEASKYIEKKIKAALLSTVYHPSRNDDPVQAASFSINVEHTAFKPVQYLSGALLYSTDGEFPSEKPILIAANSLVRVSDQDHKKFAQELLKSGGGRTVVKQINDIRIDNLNGYEIIAEGKTKANMPELLYQVVLFTEDDYYYFFLGKSGEDREKYLETFKRVAKTFKRKHKK